MMYLRDHKLLLKKQQVKATSPTKKKKIQGELIQIEKELIKSHQKSREDEEEKGCNRCEEQPKVFL